MNRRWFPFSFLPCLCFPSFDFCFVFCFSCLNQETGPRSPGYPAFPKLRTDPRCGWSLRQQCPGHRAPHGGGSPRGPPLTLCSPPRFPQFRSRARRINEGQVRDNYGVGGNGGCIEAGYIFSLEEWDKANRRPQRNGLPPPPPFPAPRSFPQRAGRGLDPAPSRCSPRRPWHAEHPGPPERSFSPHPSPGLLPVSSRTCGLHDLTLHPGKPQDVGERGAGIAQGGGWESHDLTPPGLPTSPGPRAKAL